MRIHPESAPPPSAALLVEVSSKVERAPGEVSRFGALLGHVGAAVAGGDGLMTRAARGGFGDLDSAQLIALQVGVYRYSEAVDLAAKLVDRAASAVRTVVSGH